MSILNNCATSTSTTPNITDASATCKPEQKKFTGFATYIPGQLKTAKQVHGLCLVCGDDGQKCKASVSDLNYIGCFDFAGRVKEKEVIEGYDGQKWRCVSNSARSHVPFFKPVENLSEDEMLSLADYKEQQELIKKQKAAQTEEIKRTRFLSDSEAAKCNQKIIDALPFGDRTIADLKRRGFNDDEIGWIKAFGVREVVRGQRLPFKLDPRLPGVNLDGNLVIHGDGYICPIPNEKGEIVRLQERFFEPLGGKTRYLPLSTPDNATWQLNNGEQVLGFFMPPSGKPEGIAFVEGTSAKCWWVACKYNLLVIGGIGGNHLSSEEQLKRYIDHAFNKYGVMSIHEIADAGWLLNPHVCQQVLNRQEFYKEHYTITNYYFWDWEQLTKDVGDIDEITDWHVINKLKLEGFERKYKVLAYESLINRTRDWAKNRNKLTADITKVADYYKPEDLVRCFDSGKRGQANRAFMGARKTFNGVKGQFMIHQKTKMPVFNLCARVKLSQQTVKIASDISFNAYIVSDLQQKIEGSDINFSSDSTFTSLCVDSLMKVVDDMQRAKESTGYMIMIDEVDSVLKHLIDGGTLKNKQAEIQKQFTWALENASFVYVADANLNDQHISFLRKLAPNINWEVFKLEPSKEVFNEKVQRKVTFVNIEHDSSYNVNPKAVRALVLRYLEEGKNLAIPCESKTTAKVIDSICKELGYKTFVLSSETSSTPEAQEFVKNPAKYLAENKIQVMLYTPTAENGLSIDFKTDEIAEVLKSLGVGSDYFDTVIFMICGILSSNALLQMPARYRNNKVETVYICPEFSNISNLKLPCEKQIQNVVSDKTQYFLKMLEKAETEEDQKELIRLYADTLTASINSQIKDSPYFHESVRLSKELEDDHANLKLRVKIGTLQAGHLVREINLSNQNSKIEQDEYKNKKENVLMTEATDIFNSEEVDFETAQQMKQADLTYADQCKVKRAFFLKKLPGIENTEAFNPILICLLELKNPTFLSERLRLKMLENEEFLLADFKQRNAGKFYYDDKFQDNLSPMDILRSQHLRIEAIKELGIMNLLTEEEIATNNPNIIETLKTYSKNKKLQERIGIPLAAKNKNFVKTMLDRFLSLFGLKLKTGKRKNAERLYTVVIKDQKIEPYLHYIDKCLDRRIQETIDKARNESIAEAIEDKERLEDYDDHPLEASAEPVETAPRHKLRKVNSPSIQQQQTEDDEDSIDDLEFLKIYLETCWQINDEEEFNKMSKKIDKRGSVGTITQLKEFLEEKSIPVLFSCR